MSKTVPVMVQAAVGCASAAPEPAIWAGLGASGRTLSAVELKLCCATALNHVTLENMYKNTTGQ